MAVVPAVALEVLRERRAEVLRRMRALGEGGVLLLPSMPLAARNGDVEHPYRCESDFFWLTGFEEPEAVAVLSADAKAPFTLFVRPRDKEKEIWNGRRAGVEGAVRDFGADEAFPIEELPGKLTGLLRGAQTLFYRLGGVDEALDRSVAKLLATLRQRARLWGPAPSVLVDPGQILHELRLRKAPEEVALLRRAAELTRRGHLAAMARGRPAVREYELQALLEREYRGGGGRGSGYYPIVAAGANATVLHYHENESEVRPGDLVLVDSGAEVDNYTADVTRTFPADGRFTPLQRDAYQIVLAAADHCFSRTRPGETLDALHDGAVRVLTEGMVSLGLLRGPVDDLVRDGAYKRYYMHRTSHWLGLDVHDAGPYRDRAGNPQRLEPGMVFTVEPGLYVAEDDESAPAALRGLGIRIEDDLLVTKDGYENLTAQIPRTVAQVEEACSASR